LVLHPGKKAIRALGVSESFRPAAKRSSLAGVVMRTDLVVDGFVLGEATLGGEDATSSILRMYRRMKRGDVNLILLSGCIISRYNIVDVDGLAGGSGLPVVCLTYRESGGIEDAIRSHFADPEGRLERYRRLGRRAPVTLRTGQRIYVRTAGITEADATRVLDSFTKQGGVPEPVRLASLLARAVSRPRRA
jgi:endonuclease V-like protein UPF0215 family